MKFDLSMAKHFFDDISEDNERKKYEKLGFKFKRYKPTFMLTPNKECWMVEEDTKIEIKDLNDLMDFVKIYGEITLDTDRIIIYNDYLE